MIALASIDLDVDPGPDTDVTDAAGVDSPAAERAVRAASRAVGFGAGQSEEDAGPPRFHRVGPDFVDAVDTGSDDDGPLDGGGCAEPAFDGASDDDPTFDPVRPRRTTVASLSDLLQPAPHGEDAPVVRRAADLLGPAPRHTARRRPRRAAGSPSGGERAAGEGEASLDGRVDGQRERGGSHTERSRRAARPAVADEPGADVGEAGEPGEPGRRGRRASRGRDAADRRGRARSGAPAEAPPDPVAAARTICLRLLESRARTRQELAQALRRKGVPDDAAESVLERFGEVGLIDDKAFADQWVRSRHTFSGLGRRAIAVELRRKGVDSEIAGEALAEVDDGAEETRARALVDRKLRTARGVPDESTARRLLGMLARKGYPAGIAYRVVREAVAEHAAELAEQIPTDEDS